LFKYVSHWKDASMLKRVLFTLTIILAVSIRCYSYTFENYEWGTPINKIELILAQKNKKYEFDKTRAIIKYKDVIFENECYMVLSFTPKTYLLCSIGMFWENNGIGIKLKEILTEKYGVPLKEDVEIYRWISNDCGDYIVLDYSTNDTKCGYFSGKYVLQHNKEEKDKTSKDSSRF
jgi:hypothetical protein